MTDLTHKWSVRLGTCLILLAAASFCTGRALGQDADEDASSIFNRAVELKLSAKSMDELEKVVSLCEKALEKGLSDDEAKLARQMASMTLYEHAFRLSREIFERQPPNERWRTIRSFALKDIEKALQLDPNLGAAYLLTARLESLPGGDTDKAKEFLAKAIELLKNDDTLLSQALMTRAQMEGDLESRIKDLDRAIQLDENNTEAWRTRGLLYMASDQSDKALDSLLKLLERNPDDLVAHQAVAEVLAEMKKFDEAMEHVSKVIEANPKSSLPYQLKARILLAQEKTDEAIAVLNVAVDANPSDANTYLLRATARTIKEEYEAARADVNRAMELNPNSSQAVLQRALLNAAQDKYPQAIQDLETILASNPQNHVLRLQLGYFYVSDKRPSKAVEVFTQVIDAEPQNAKALRARGDAYLSISKQKEALADYEAALKADPEDSGLLNNLAWLLATSPDASIRNADRSLELANKACELTQFKEAHILSTLAAAYAEKGDFETAIKWSTQAVELGGEQRDQLKKELENYERKEPWREVQSTEEKPSTEPPSADEILK